MAEQVEKRVVSKKHTGTEDRSRQGWPGTSRFPFISMEYYREFPESLQPQPIAGAAAEVNLTRSELERIQHSLEAEVAVQTYVNMAMKPRTVAILGANGTSMVHVIIPPFGLIRGLPDQLGKVGMWGSNYYDLQPAPPEGSCNRQDSFTVKDGRTYTTCKFTKCENHPVDSLVHSIHQAQWLIARIGEALPDPLHPERASYIPEDKKHQTEDVIFKYNTIDPRPEVTVFAQRRLQEFKERLARRIAAAQAGALKLGETGHTG